MCPSSWRGGEGVGNKIKTSKKCYRQNLLHNRGAWSKLSPARILINKLREQPPPAGRRKHLVIYFQWWAEELSSTHQFTAIYCLFESYHQCSCIAIFPKPQNKIHNIQISWNNFKSLKITKFSVFVEYALKRWWLLRQSYCYYSHFQMVWRLSFKEKLPNSFPSSLHPPTHTLNYLQSLTRTLLLLSKIIKTKTLGFFLSQYFHF